MSDSKSQLKEVYQLIKSGKKQQARQILMPILKVEKDNSTAWFLMANAVDKQEQQVKALQKVLNLRPDHQKAQEMLDKLQAPPVSKPQPAAPPKAVAAPVVVSDDDDDPFAPPKKSRRKSKVGDDNPFAEFDDDDDPFAPPKKSRRKSKRADDHLFVDPFDDDDDPFKHLGKPKNNHIGKVNYNGSKKKNGIFSNADGSTNIAAVILAFFGGMLACGVLACGGFFFVAASISEEAFEQILQESEYYDEDYSFSDVSLDTARSMGDIQNYLTVHNRLSDAFDEHAYNFRADAGQVMEIELNATTAGLDTYVTLYGPGDVYVAENDDRDLSSGNTNSYLYFSLPDSGNYTIIVSSWSGDGEYDLTLRLN